MRIRLARTTPRSARSWGWARTSDWPGITAAVAVPTLLVAGLLAPLHSNPHPHAVAAAHEPAQAQQARSHDYVTVAAPSPTATVITVRTTAKAAPTTRTSDTPRHAVLVSALASDGIPRTALDAYQNAAKRADAAHATCKLPWPLLAGIGRVESDHGRFAGAVLYADGTSSTKIIGIRLDGSRSALIRDTDHGRLDGDTQFDRAVGPMQFIPSTWASFGADGNGDGRKDPFNIFDAALAAANYLCVAGGDLSTLAGQTRAVLAYNHSSAYLDEVLALEKAYAAGVGIVVPVGPPPPAQRPPHLPPVNPGPPPDKPAHHRPRPHPTRTPTVSPTPTPTPSPSPSHTSTPTPDPSSSSSCATPSPTSSTSTSAPDSTSSSTSATATPSPSDTSTSTSPSASPTPTC